MFESLGRFLFRRRRWVLAAAGVFVVVAAVWGTGVFGSLGGAGFEDPDSDSARAAQQAKRVFGRHQADVVVLYSSPTLTVDDPAFRTAAQRTLGALPRRYVAKVTSYWDTGAPQLVSTDRHATYAVLELAGADGDAREEALEEVTDELAAPGLSTRLGGAVAIDHDIDTQVAKDIARAETLSTPLLVVLLVVVFGALAAAGMPLLVGGLAILGAFTALRLLTMVTDVSVFAINIVTMLGLGLGIDYALFVVSRFREELAARPPGRQGVQDALVRTVATAGRTVAFSGLTVAISLAGLLLFPQMFLRSMAFGGIAAVLVAMAGALTVLPALLGVLGPRINALSVPWLRRRRGRATDGSGGAWYRVAHSVMRRPLAYMAVIVVGLLALGLPFRNVTFGGIDARALPAGTQSRQVSQTLDRDFTRNATTLSGLLGFTPTGTVEATQPILMLAIAFGLSMDYEVFLLSRVREQWGRTGNNTTAVATGLQ